MHWISVPVALVIGTVGAVSVVNMVYIDKRTLRCACAGGANMPLGFLSLTENLMMVARQCTCPAIDDIPAFNPIKHLAEAFPGDETGTLA